MRFHLLPQRHRLPDRRSSSAGTSAGGSGGGASSRLSSTHLPRSTGEVRVAYDDTVSTLACVSTPPRCPPVRSTRRKLGPVTPATP